MMVKFKKLWYIVSVVYQIWTWIMPINLVPSPATFTGNMNTADFFLTAVPVYFADSDSIKLSGFVKEVGSVSIVMSLTLWQETTSFTIPVAELDALEPGEYLEGIAGFGNKNMSLVCTRTKLANTGRIGQYWYLDSMVLRS